jgi:hypothetical protein
MTQPLPKRTRAHVLETLSIQHIQSIPPRVDLPPRLNTVARYGHPRE